MCSAPSTTVAAQELNVRIPDDEPLRPRIEYCRTLVRLRDCEVWRQTLQVAMQQARLLASLTGGRLH